jgi:SulP family sulfate permease
LVAVLSITVNIVLAVFLGVVIAIVLFVLRMSRSNIRRSYRCDSIRSRKTRGAAEIEVLERSGGSILVMELEGPLFFGSAEKLASQIEAALQHETRWLILDLRRITEIDSTGARIILDIQADLAGRDKRLILALTRTTETAERLADFGVLDAVSSGKVFEDVDRAIECAEDDLLCGELHEPAPEEEMSLDHVGLLSSFSAGDIAAINTHLTRVVHDKDSAIFHEGDLGSELFFITKGSASAYIRQPDGGDIRLATFAPGSVFGELAILDAGPRSASVIADSELVTYVLSEKDFAALATQTPAIAIKLLTSLGRELSGRLRRANRTIHLLEA